MKLIQTLVQQTNKDYSSQYAGILSNHLPMALFALDALGADQVTLERFHKRYIKRLSPKPTQLEVTINQENWTQFLGQDRLHQDYLNYFADQIKNHGVDAVIESHVPTLFIGVAGGAFHGLIRLSYALALQLEEEIIEALGYWSISYLELGGDATIQTAPLIDFPECLQLLNKGFQNSTFEAPNIVVRMQIAKDHVLFREIMASLDANISLETLAPNMAAALCATRNFTMLHGVTACHAARTVCAKLENPQESIFYLAYALALAYVTIGAPKIEATDTSSIVVDWEQIKQVALRSLDDHIPKITYSCLREYETYQNPIFFEAAKRYVLGI